MSEYCESECEEISSRHIGNGCTYIVIMIVSSVLNDKTPFHLSLLSLSFPLSLSLKVLKKDFGQASKFRKRDSSDMYMQSIGKECVYISFMSVSSLLQLYTYTDLWILGFPNFKGYVDPSKKGFFNSTVLISHFHSTKE